MSHVRKKKWTYKGIEKFTWAVSYIDNSGARRQKSFESKKAADRYRLSIDTEIDLGEHTPGRLSLTVEKGLDLWLRDCDRRRKIGDLTGMTTKGYEWAGRKFFVGAIAKKKVSELHKLDFQRRFDEISTQYNATSMHTLRRTAKTFLSFMVEQGYTKKNIISEGGIKLPRVVKKKVKMPPKSDIAAILNAIRHHVEGECYLAFHVRAVMMTLGLFCGGMRIGEILGLQWEQVDFGRNVLHIVHSLSPVDGLKSTKTEAGTREDIPMPPIVREMLLRLLGFQRQKAQLGWVRGSNRTVTTRLIALFTNPPAPDLSEPMPTGFVCVANSGRPIGQQYVEYINGVLRKAGLSTEAGQRHTMHSLRHAYASMLIEDGLDPMSIKRLIGHESVQTTYNVYGHLFPKQEAERATTNRIAAQF